MPDTPIQNPNSTLLPMPDPEDPRHLIAELRRSLGHLSAAGWRGFDCAPSTLPDQRQTGRATFQFRPRGGVERRSARSMADSAGAEYPIV